MSSDDSRILKNINILSMLVIVIVIFLKSSFAKTFIVENDDQFIFFKFVIMKEKYKLVNHWFNLNLSWLKFL
jgi:hypothetical protein